MHNRILKSLHATKLATLCALLSVLLIACSPEPAAESIGNADLAARIAASDAPIILDVRSNQEFKAGHVPGAIHIPHTEIAERISELTPFKSETIVVYCRSGGRAQSATEVLAANGFTGVIELTGHMQAWSESGLPLE